MTKAEVIAVSAGAIAAGVVVYLATTLTSSQTRDVVAPQEKSGFEQVPLAEESTYGIPSLMPVSNVQDVASSGMMIGSLNPIPTIQVVDGQNVTLQEPMQQVEQQTQSNMQYCPLPSVSVENGRAYSRWDLISGIGEYGSRLWAIAIEGRRQDEAGNKERADKLYRKALEILEQRGL